MPVFYAVTLFLHFRHLHLSGSSLHNTGTKSTERIICELRGKPTRFSPLTPGLLSQTCLKTSNLTSMPNGVWLKLVPKWDNRQTEDNGPLRCRSICREVKNHTIIPPSTMIFNWNEQKIARFQRCEGKTAAVWEMRACWSRCCSQNTQLLGYPILVWLSWSDFM